MTGGDPSVLASASAIFGPDFQGALCNHVAPNYTQNRINGGKKTNDLDGIMAIRIIPNGKEWNYDFGETTTTGYYDLYSVVLHEALHILGFASNLGLDAKSFYDQTISYAPNNIFTIWDDLLFVTPEYEENGMSSNVSKVLESTCLNHCKTLNSSVFPTGSAFNTAVEFNCSTSGSLDFMIGESGIAPVWGGGSGDDISVVNSLSHLNVDCNGHGENYIMQPTIGEATDRRQITTTEMDILCELGYNISGCNKCYLTSINTPTDLNYYNAGSTRGDSEFNCCPRNYFVCSGEELIIPFEDLLCDKFSNGTMEIIDAYNTIFDPMNPGVQMRGEEVVISGETVIVTPISGSTSGSIYLNFEVKICACTIERFVIIVRIGECLECTSTDICDNLVCTEGFEEMSNIAENNSLSYFEQIGGGYHVYEGNELNGFGFCQDNSDNTYVILLNKKTNNSLTKNGISFKLSHPIQPGCTATISFKYNTKSGDTAIEILGSEMPPCYFLDSKIKHGCQPTNCGDYIYNPICIENMDLEGGVPFASTSCSSTPNLTDIEDPIIWVNEGDFPINYIMFSVNPSANSDFPVYLDDFIVTNECPVDACFDFVVDCKTVMFEPCFNEGFQHQWIFGDGNISTEANPIHTYTANGTYNVQHNIRNLCDNSTDFTIHEVVIDCVENSCVCEEEGSVNINAGGGTLLSSLTLPPYSINNKCISIIGKLIVDKPYNIYSSEIKMNEGSEISIIDGGRLNLLDVNMDGGIHGCDYMWKGITVEENGYLALSNSIIQDAHHAVTLHDDSYHYITNTLFNKNYIGIFIPPDPLPNKMLNINQTFPIYGNIFDCEGENCILLAPYEDQPAMVLNKPYAGIIVNNAVYAIGSLQGGIVTHAPNNFYDVKNGIITSHSAIASYKSNFESPSGGSFNQFTAHNSIESNNSLTVIERNKMQSRLAALHSRQDYGSRIINNEISRCWRGVNYLHSGLFINDIISNNSMQVLTTGIYFNSHKSPIHISDNQLGKFNNLGSSKESIEILGQYVSSEIVNNRINLSYNKNGILLTNVTNALITQNEIRNSAITSTNDNPIGIKLSDAHNSIISKNEIYEVSLPNLNTIAMEVNESTKNLICCNELNAGTSIKFDGMCDDTQLKNNEFKGYHKVGLLCHESTSIGIQSNSGNTWANSTVVSNNAIDAQHEEKDDQNFILQSQILVNDCPSSYWPAEIFPEQDDCSTESQDWIRLDLFGTINEDCTDCPTVNNYLWVKQITQNDLNYIDGMYYNTYFSNKFNWEKGKHLYRKIYKDTTLINYNSTVTGFYNTTKLSSIGKLVELEEAIQKLNILPQVQRDSLNDIEVDIEIHLINIRELDSLIANATTSIDSNSLSVDRMGEISDISSLFGQVKTIHSNVQLGKRSKVDSLIAVNNSISTSHVIDFMEKYVNKIYLETVGKDSLQFTNSQGVNLFNIAKECPQEYGSVVYRARNLYSFIDQEMIFDDSDCHRSSPPLLLKQEKDLVPQVSADIKLSMNVRPNPSRDMVELDWSESVNPEEGELMFELMSMQGRSVWGGKAQISDKKLQIDLSGLSAGMYILRVLKNGQVKDIKKILVLK